MVLAVSSARNVVKTRDFFTAGNALFTVSNPRGEHYTFKIYRPTYTNGSGPLFVNLLTGPQNTSDFTYIGILDHGLFDLRLTKLSRLKADSPPVKVLRWALTVYRNGHLPPAGYNVQHEGRCCRCGRLLTTPESIERGIGPDCAGKAL